MSEIDTATQDAMFLVAFRGMVQKEIEEKVLPFPDALVNNSSGFESDVKGYFPPVMFREKRVAVQLDQSTIDDASDQTAKEISITLIIRVFYDEILKEQIEVDSQINAVNIIANHFNDTRTMTTTAGLVWRNFNTTKMIYMRYFPGSKNFGAEMRLTAETTMHFTNL